MINISHTAPPVPEEMIAEMFGAPVVDCEREDAQKLVDWGYAQAIPEREKLRVLLVELSWFVGKSPLEGALVMQGRASNAAEMLRRSGTDG
jgi:hypothetical protein